MKRGSRLEAPSTDAHPEQNSVLKRLLRCISFNKQPHDTNASLRAQAQPLASAIPAETHPKDCIGGPGPGSASKLTMQAPRPRHMVHGDPSTHTSISALHTEAAGWDPRLNNSGRIAGGHTASPQADKRPRSAELLHALSALHLTVPPNNMQRHSLNKSAPLGAPLPGVLRTSRSTHDVRQTASDHRLPKRASTIACIDHSSSSSNGDGGSSTAFPSRDAGALRGQRRHSSTSNEFIMNRLISCQDVLDEPVLSSHHTPSATRGIERALGQQAAATAHASRSQASSSNASSSSQQPYSASGTPSGWPSWMVSGGSPTAGGAQSEGQAGVDGFSFQHAQTMGPLPPHSLSVSGPYLPLDAPARRPSSSCAPSLTSIPELPESTLLLVPCDDVQAEERGRDSGSHMAYVQQQLQEYQLAKGQRLSSRADRSRLSSSSTSVTAPNLSTTIATAAAAGEAALAAMQPTAGAPMPTSPSAPPSTPPQASGTQAVPALQTVRLLSSHGQASYPTSAEGSPTALSAMQIPDIALLDSRAFVTIGSLGAIHTAAGTSGCLESGAMAAVVTLGSMGGIMGLLQDLQQGDTVAAAAGAGAAAGATSSRTLSTSTSSATNSLTLLASPVRRSLTGTSGRVLSIMNRMPSSNGSISKGAGNEGILQMRGLSSSGIIATSAQLVTLGQVEAGAASTDEPLWMLPETSDETGVCATPGEMVAGTTGAASSSRGAGASQMHVGGQCSTAAPGCAPCSTGEIDAPAVLIPKPSPASPAHLELELEAGSGTAAAGEPYCAVSGEQPTYKPPGPLAEAAGFMQDWLMPPLVLHLQQAACAGGSISSEVVGSGGRRAVPRPASGSSRTALAATGAARPAHVRGTGAGQLRGPESWTFCSGAASDSALASSGYVYSQSQVHVGQSLLDTPSSAGYLHVSTCGVAGCEDKSRVGSKPLVVPAGAQGKVNPAYVGNSHMTGTPTSVVGSLSALLSTSATHVSSSSAAVTYETTGGASSCSAVTPEPVLGNAAQPL